MAEDEEDIDWKKIMVDLLSDPKVLSALALSGLVYHRAGDIDSLIVKYTTWIRKQVGLSPEESKWMIFAKKAAALMIGGITLFVASELINFVRTKAEIDRLRNDYNEKLRLYNSALARHEVAIATDRPDDWEDVEPRPVLYYGPPGFALSEEDKKRIEKQFKKDLEEWEFNNAHRRDLILHYLKAFNWIDPGPPIPDPMIALWDSEGVEISTEDRLAYAVVAFVIAMNPELLTGTLKGLGEIMQGVGEIVPL